MQLVNQFSLQILPDCPDTATDADIASSCRVFRTLQSNVDSVRHEMERRAAFHLNRVSRMMRQDKDRNVIGWRITPPALPRFIRPWSTNRPEHISSEDPR